MSPAPSSRSGARSWERTTTPSVGTGRASGSNLVPGARMPRGGVRERRRSAARHGDPASSARWDDHGRARVGVREHVTSAPNASFTRAAVSTSRAPPPRRRAPARSTTRSAWSAANERSNRREDRLCSRARTPQRPTSRVSWPRSRCAVGRQSRTPRPARGSVRATRAGARRPRATSPSLSASLLEPTTRSAADDVSRGPPAPRDSRAVRPRATSRTVKAKSLTSSCGTPGGSGGLRPRGQRRQ